MAESGALTAANGLLDELVRELATAPNGQPPGASLDQIDTGRRILALDRAEKAQLVAAAVGRIRDLERAAAAAGLESSEEGRRNSYMIVLLGLLNRKQPLAEETVAGLLDWLADASFNVWATSRYPLAAIATAAENLAAREPLADAVRAAIGRAVAHLRKQPRDTESRKAIERLTALAALGTECPIDPGEAWSDAALADLEAMPAGRRAAWHDLLAHCQEVRSAPSDLWLKDAQRCVEAVGREDFLARLIRWFPLVDRPRTVPIPPANARETDWDDLIQPHHVDVLKGLASCAGLEADRDLAAALAALALCAYRAVPGKGTGPRLVSLGHAAVAALGMMPGMDAISQLVLLKMKVRYSPAQRVVETALIAALEREKLPRDEIEELTMPAFGMDAVGRRRDVLGDHAADLIVDGPYAYWAWSKVAEGTPLHTAPTAVKKEHAQTVKELQGVARDVGTMLTAQRQRIDRLFLAGKHWPLDAWRARYLDHPLLGTIARRLLWRFQGEAGGQAADGIWHDDRLVGVDDHPLDGLGAVTTVTLWHPIDRPIDEVMAWRDWLDRHQVRQPFKQAHREVYVLTDAERATRDYSNRFAAHILRQNPYHTLCTARGWKDPIRLMVDGTFPPTSRDLSAWGLRAEFWVEGIGDDLGDDTSASGAFLHLSTDQVRFYEIGAETRHAPAGGRGDSTRWYRTDAELLPLDRVPPLVFSEIFRDVDLFVGAASVGNDPTWSDGGPDGRHVDYWNGFSFGPLSAHGQTRKAVLEKLVPRLKIAWRCTFSDKFLVVRGDLRTYKIHLGSGNILMEPNDQYLCIVSRPMASEVVGPGGVFLPFEGDDTLSIILSKALLLADDLKISDPTVVSQIKR